jgi:hypothetical protein
LTPDAVLLDAGEPEPWDEMDEIMDSQEAEDLEPVEELADADD